VGLGEEVVVGAVGDEFVFGGGCGQAGGSGALEGVGRAAGVLEGVWGARGGGGGAW